MNGTLLWTVEALAAELAVSKRTIHGWTGARTIPCRWMPNSRRVVFLPAEIVAWIDAGGTLPLEVQELHGGGFVVRPKDMAA